jgi:hypothetical protein
VNCNDHSAIVKFYVESSCLFDSAKSPCSCVGKARLGGLAVYGAAVIAPSFIKSDSGWASFHKAKFCLLIRAKLFSSRSWL